MLPANLPAELAKLAARGARVLAPRTAVRAGVPSRDLTALLDAALAAPASAPRLAELAPRGARVLLVVSDATRDEPREELLAAARRALAHLPDDAFTIAVASGTHAPRPAERVLSARWRDAHRVVVHDGLDLEACVELGVTAEGTRVRVNRAAVEADVVVSLGRVRPHYFAGFSGGAKGIFPGLGASVDVRQNHLLKADPSARLGRTDDNRCRRDMEAAAALLPARTYLVNVVADADHAWIDAVAGDLVLAHREACRRAAPWFEVEAPRRAAPVVVVSDAPPVTSSLYQACKLLPPAGPLLAPGGTVIAVAACEEGTGPLATVNDGIYKLGVRLALPEGHRVTLVSTMSEETVATTFASFAPSLEAALAEAGAPLDEVVVLWRAGEAIVRA